MSGLEEQLVVEEGEEYQSPYQSVVLHQTEVDTKQLILTGQSALYLHFRQQTVLFVPNNGYCIS